MQQSKLLSISSFFFWFLEFAGMKLHIMQCLRFFLSRERGCVISLSLGHYLYVFFLFVYLFLCRYVTYSVCSRFSLFRFLSLSLSLLLSVSFSVSRSVSIYISISVYLSVSLYLFCFVFPMCLFLYHKFSWLCIISFALMFYLFKSLAKTRDSAKWLLKTHLHVNYPHFRGGKTCCIFQKLVVIIHFLTIFTTRIRNSRCNTA